MGWENEVLKVLEVDEIISMIEDKVLFHIEASNNSDRYITYRLINEKASYSTGTDNELITKYTVQIDVNSIKRDKIYNDLIKKIKELAKLNKWIKGAVFEDKDLETGIFFYCLRFDFNLLNK